MKSRQAILAILTALLSWTAAAEEFIEWVGANSGVNWSAGQIQAEGAGIGPANSPPSLARMMACRAAVVDAQRNLLESIQGVRVEGTTVVANMMVESDVIKTSVNGVLQGAQTISREPQADGSCVVTMVAPLGGKFTSDVYKEVFEPATIGMIPAHRLGQWLDAGLAIIIPGARAQTSETPAWQQAIDRLSARISSLEELISSHPAVIEAGNQGPTGLVLDARGSNFIPSMSPKIRKLRAGVLYPNPKHQASRSERGQLVSLFTRDLDTARRHPIVGTRPIVMKALRTWGDTRTEIVLDTSTAQRLEALVAEGFLDDSGVIIVL